MSDTLTMPATEIPAGTLEALSRSELFGALAPAALQELAARSVLKNVRRGERIWSRGDQATALAVVASGRVKCWSPGHDARQWVNVIARPGVACGLAACVDGGPHTCNAEPLERSRVVLVPTSAVRAAMERTPSFARAVANHLARDVRRVLGVCEDVTLRTPVERLARFLVAQAAGGVVVELRETQTQIAAQLGTVREVVGRGLRHLESRGVISRTGRVVRVLRPRDLDVVAGGGA
jgi:CRP-like cAMP-binding protein